MKHHLAARTSNLYDHVDEESADQERDHRVNCNRKFKCLRALPDGSLGNLSNVYCGILNLLPRHFL